MDSLETPALDGSATLDAYLNQRDHFQIYTHSIKTRLIVLGLFTAYLLCFTYVTHRMRAYIDTILEGRAALGAMGASSDPNWLIFGIAGLTLVVALVFFFYFFWAMVDVWGLQVWCSQRELRVQNTITGNTMRRWTGVGSLLIEDITEIRGAKLYTRVIGQQGQLRFSPVDRLDQLISAILANAKDAKIVS